MYEELIKQMRSVYQEVDCPDCPLAKDCMTLQSVCAFTRAADAIEELNKCLDGVNDAHNEGYDVGYWAGRRDYEPKWIPVTERLPEKHEFVLVYSKLVKMRTDFISNDGQWYTTPGVTHWMSLPEPPKEET